MKSLIALTLLGFSCVTYGADNAFLAVRGFGDGDYKGLEYRIGRDHLFGGFDFGQWKSADKTLDSGMAGLFLGAQSGTGILNINAALHLYAETIDNPKSFGEATSSLTPWGVSAGIQSNIGRLTLSGSARYLHTSDSIVKHEIIGTRVLYMVGVGVNF